MSPPNRTLFQSYLALPANTRLGISLAVCVVGVTGLVLSDYLEKNIQPLPNSKNDKE